MFLEADLYKEIVRSLPIVCVDLLLTSDIHEGYLQVKRMQEPMKGHMWPPGGRKFINEHFLDGAFRIAQSELGLQKGDLELSNEIAGLYSDIFQRSSFGTHTYETLSILVRGKLLVESLKYVHPDHTIKSVAFEDKLPLRLVQRTIWYK